MSEFHPLRKAALATGIALGSLAAPAAAAAEKADTVKPPVVEVKHDNTEEILEWKIAGSQPVTLYNGDLVVVQTDGKERHIPNPLVVMPEKSVEPFYDIIDNVFKPSYDASTGLPKVSPITYEESRVSYVYLLPAGKGGSGFPGQGDTLEGTLFLGNDSGTLTLAPNFGAATKTADGHSAFVDYDGHPSERTAGTDAYIDSVQSESLVYQMDYGIPGRQAGARVNVGREFTTPPTHPLNPQL